MEKVCWLHDPCQETGHIVDMRTFMRMHDYANKTATCLLQSRRSHASASWHSAQRTLRGIQKAIGKLNFVAGTFLFSLQAFFHIFFSYFLFKFQIPTCQDKYQPASVLCTISHYISCKTRWTSATKSAPPPVLAMATVPNLLDQWLRLASPAQKRCANVTMLCESCNTCRASSTFVKSSAINTTAFASGNQNPATTKACTKIPSSSHSVQLYL